MRSSALLLVVLIGCGGGDVVPPSGIVSTTVCVGSLAVGDRMVGAFRVHEFGDGSALVTCSAQLPGGSASGVHGHEAGISSRSCVASIDVDAPTYGFFVFTLDGEEVHVTYDDPESAHHDVGARWPCTVEQ